MASQLEKIKEAEEKRKLYLVHGCWRRLKAERIHILRPGKSCLSKKWWFLWKLKKNAKETFKEQEKKTIIKSAIRDLSERITEEI